MAQSYAALINAVLHLKVESKLDLTVKLRKRAETRRMDHGAGAKTEIVGEPRINPYDFFGARIDPAYRARILMNSPTRQKRLNAWRIGNDHKGLWWCPFAGTVRTKKAQLIACSDLNARKSGSHRIGRHRRLLPSAQRPAKRLPRRGNSLSRGTPRESA